MRTSITRPGYGVTARKWASQAGRKTIFGHSKNLSRVGRKCESATCCREADFILVVAADWDTYNKFLTTELVGTERQSRSQLSPFERRSRVWDPIPIDEE